MEAQGFGELIKEQYRNIHNYSIITLADGGKICHSGKTVELKLIAKSRGEHFLERQQKYTRVSHVYGEIFKQTENDKKPIKKVLVEGGAGMGKTTLCASLSKGWANGDILKEYDILFFLPLDNNEVATASSLSGLIDQLKLRVDSQEAASYIKHRCGSGVIFIADGWQTDFFSKGGSQEGSFCYNLLFGNILEHASVIVSSRPTASAVLHGGNLIDRFIEIGGFADDSMTEFVQSEFAVDLHGVSADGLLEQIHYNPVLKSMCSVPIACTKVCQLWRTSQTQRSFPTTATKLCTKIILSILSSACQNENVIDLTDIDNLPKPVQESWWHLCELAFLSIRRSKVDLSQFNSFQHGILATSFVEYDDTNQSSVSFHFIHPTSQEYFAALHLVKQCPSIFKAFDTINFTLDKFPLFLRYFLDFLILVSANIYLMKI